MATAHVIGAGLAGLSAALGLSSQGWEVQVHEASGQAGGRCRSFHDSTLGCVVDNGNHLLLSGNEAAMAYLREVGAQDSLAGPEDAAFPFLDLADGRQWTLRVNAGRIPWWVLDRRRRIPGTSAGDYLSAIRLCSAGEAATVTDCVGDSGMLYRRFWEPLTVAVLNTPPHEAAARPLWHALRETFGRGAAACRPRVARTGLGDSFVAPALRVLERRGVAVRYGARLRAVERNADGVKTLQFGASSVAVTKADRVVLAIPPTAFEAILPEIPCPRGSHAIVNAHFRLDRPVGNGWEAPFLGLVGGTAQWLFLRGDVASVTVSAADALAAEPVEAVALRLWPDVARALGLSVASPPAWRIVKERRATFAQTPAAMRGRPGPRLAPDRQLSNLLLAGDWTDTGLPATIEGAIRSGRAAAAAARPDHEITPH